MPRYNPFGLAIEEATKRAARLASVSAAQQAAAPASEDNTVIAATVDNWGNLTRYGILGVTPLGLNWILH